MRQTLRLPLRCTRDELYEARRAITPYDAVAVSVRGHGGNKRAAAAVSLADLVGEQVHLAQEQGVFTPPKGHEQDPHVGMHGCHTVVAGRCHPLRCVCWGLAWWPSLASARNPDNWLTRWVMDGSDDRGRLCAMDAEAGLNAQIEHL